MLDLYCVLLFICEILGSLELFVSMSLDIGQDNGSSILECFVAHLCFFIWVLVAFEDLVEVFDMV